MSRLVAVQSWVSISIVCVAGCAPDWAVCDASALGTCVEGPSGQIDERGCVAHGGRYKTGNCPPNRLDTTCELGPDGPFVSFYEPVVTNATSTAVCRALGGRIIAGGF